MLDLLEKGMREIDDNDWMTAYDIEGHPDVHLSHHYFRNLSGPQVQQIMGAMKSHFEKNPLQAKTLDLSNREMFGKDKDIPVLVNDNLVPHLDPELKNFFQKIQPSQYSFRPHVTTDKPAVQGKIKRFYLKRGNGQTYFSVDASQPESGTMNQPQKIEKSGSNMPTVNAKVENIEVKRTMSGAGMQKVGASVAPMAGTAPKVPVPPKPSPTTGKMNNMPTQPMKKAEPGAAKSAIPKEPTTIDYSKFQRPQYSSTGSVPPIHKPIQHSRGAMQGMAKADCPPCVEKLRKLRKCLNKSDKEPMPVHMRD